MPHNYDLKTTKGKFDVQISTSSNYGCFEHEHFGDECGGGLWFDDNKELEDFDGAIVLPKEVADAIIELGYSVDKDHFCI